MANVAENLAKGNAKHINASKVAEALAKERPLSPEEEYLRSLSPVDAYKFSVEAQNARRYSPEEAAQNRENLLLDAAYSTPLLSNILSVRDAYEAKDEANRLLKAGDEEGAQRQKALAATSAFGAFMPFNPMGRMANSSVRGAQSSTRIFAGPMAKTADKTALAKAEQMAQSGASRDDIWRETGWFQGADGKWRFEIDDSKSYYDADAYKELKEAAEYDGRKYDPSFDNAQLDFALGHKDFYSAYPGINETPLAFIAGTDEIIGGVSHGKGMALKNNLDETTGRSFALHEGQHLTQAKEGFSSGGSPRAMLASGEMMSPEIEKARAVVASLERGTPEYKAALQKQVELEMDEAYRQYHRLAGEVEARNVQTRMNYTPEQRRASPPWETQDVPDEQQIVRFGSQGLQSSVTNFPSTGKQGRMSVLARQIDDLNSRADLTPQQMEQLDALQGEYFNLRAQKTEALKGIDIATNRQSLVQKKNEIMSAREGLEREIAMIESGTQTFQSRRQLQMAKERLSRILADEQAIDNQIRSASDDFNY